VIHPPPRRAVLTPAQRDEVARGRFVRVGGPLGGALVGRVDGTWRAYVNECRHRELPLDLGVRSPMSDDGRHLLCHQHGALYRLDDGMCTVGPCAGASLEPLEVREEGDAILLEPAPRYPYVAVDVDEADAEEAGARLFELGAQGVEQRDATTLVRSASPRVTLVAGFPDRGAADAAVVELPGAWDARVEEVVGDAWRDAWKKHFEPFAICPGVVVRPPWREFAPKRGERVVVLEPGRAFGTGLHETTSLVAGVLADPAAGAAPFAGPILAGADVLDVGCGSGVLSLVALALGAARARAVDVDPDAVAVTRENAERNGVADRLEVDDVPVELAPGIAPRVASGGELVLSGILAADVAPGQVDDVRRAYPGFEDVALHRKGEWVALVLRKRRDR
jgi:ribosomal protein L11 methyltransferase